eukprot:TRINITY_DN13361_c0_g1_i1.p2 TRINITY_DN13361_c0_g1~~TRINITY_DN13361_c0_g1_i1.p2  ORF type:complete len:142 (-),score=27.01 TRINITY_DN13361_c0_g1_i1:48-473(-)
MECLNSDCKKRSCMVCRKEVMRLTISLHVGGGADDDKEENCWKYMSPKAQVELAAEIAINGKCPDCGKSGRKDDNCTHINDCGGVKNKKRCSANWCYMCGLKKEECDRGGNRGFVGHNVEWQRNTKRCPLFAGTLCGGSQV